MSDCIITPRLVLRQYAPQDAARIAALIGDINIARWLLHVPHPYSASDAAAFIDRNAGDCPHVYAITLQGAIVGGVSIKGGLGYWLGKAFWGFGYATEAARALVAQYFAAGATGLTSGHILGNSASRKVLGKLGFVDTHVEQAHCAATQTPVQVQKMYLPSHLEVAPA